MRRLLAISDILAWPCRVVAHAMGLLLFVLAAVIIYDVIGRKFFATGSFLLQELEWHLHGAIAVLAFGYAYLKDAHVRIDVFSERFPTRTRLWIELVSILLFLVPFMVLVTMFGIEFTDRAFQSGEGSPSGIGLPHRFVIKAAVPVSAVLAILGGLAVALRIVVALWRPSLRADPFEHADG